MDIKKVLKKRTWTEKEAGQILLADLGQLALNSREPGKGKRLLKGDEIKKRCRPKILQREQPTLEAYQLLYKNLLTEYNKAVADRQRYFHGILRVIGKLDESALYEQVLAQEDKTPLLVTAEQLESYKEEYRSQKADQLQSVPQIILQMIKVFSSDPSQAPENVQEEMRKLEHKKLSKVLGLSWAKFKNTGYWVRKEDPKPEPLTAYKDIRLTINDKDFKIAIDKFLENFKLRLEKKFFFNDCGPIKINELRPEFKAAIDRIVKTSLERSNALPRTTRPRAKDKARAMSEDMEKIIRDNLYRITPENLKEFEKLHTKAELTAYKDKLEWVYSAEWPVKWTRGNILPYLPEFYQGKESQAKKDYRNLYAYTWDYLAAKMPEARGGENMFTIGQLASLELADYREQLEPTTEKIIKALRSSNPQWPKYKEIAIVDNPAPQHLDQRGFYLMAAPSEKLDKSLALAEMVQDTNGAVEILRESYKYLIFPILKAAYAYNKTIELIQEPFDLVDADLLKVNNKEVEEMAELLNRKIYRFYATVAGDQEERDEKRAIIKRLFQHIDLEAMKPTEENIKKARAAIEELDASDPASLYRLAGKINLIKSFLGGF